MKIDHDARNGREVDCPFCRCGMELYAAAVGHAEPCDRCEGSSSLWEYEGGRLAKWYGGPFV